MAHPSRTPKAIVRRWNDYLNTANSGLYDELAAGLHVFGGLQLAVDELLAAASNPGSRTLPKNVNPGLSSLSILAYRPPGQEEESGGARRPASPWRVEFESERGELPREVVQSRRDGCR